MRQASSGIRSEDHEARDEFRIDTVCLGPRAPAGGEGFDLRWRQLPGRYAGCVQCSPQSPFLPSGGFENHQRANGSSMLRQIAVSFVRVRQPQSATFWQAMNIQPITANVYTKDRLV